MIFLEWCLKAPEEEIPMDVRTTSGKHYKPNERVPVEEVYVLQNCTIIGTPYIKDNVWYITLDDK